MTFVTDKYSNLCQFSRLSSLVVQRLSRKNKKMYSNFRRKIYTKNTNWITGQLDNLFNKKDLITLYTGGIYILIYLMQKAVQVVQVVQ